MNMVKIQSPYGKVACLSHQNQMSVSHFDHKHMHHRINLKKKGGSWRALIQTLTNTWTWWSKSPRPYTCLVKNDLIYKQTCIFFINNEQPPMKIHSQMDKISSYTDVTGILTNKITSQAKISRSLPVKWNREKDMTVFDVVMCGKLQLRMKQRKHQSNDDMKKEERMNITSDDTWWRKKNDKGGLIHLRSFTWWLEP